MDSNTRDVSHKQKLSSMLFTKNINFLFISKNLDLK